MNAKSLIKRNYKKHPEIDFPDYKSSIFRAPKNRKISFPSSNTEIIGPIFNKNIIGKLDNDLTLNFSRNKISPLGHKIIVYGTVSDQFTNPIEGALIEIWQANAAGKYLHNNDENPAPIDPNFAGCGRCLTSSSGYYEFLTIQPGPYPYPNRGIEWRPMHIHFSIFGKSFGQRLITQMYFEGDPLFKYDPIFNSIPDKKAQNRLVAKFSIDETIPEFAHAYIFNIVLRGREATPMEV